MVVEEVLRQAPLFADLDEADAAELRAVMKELRLTRGQELFREGDGSEELYIVVDGKMKMGHQAPDGRENLLAVLGPGQMFGELSLFDPGPRASTVTAVTDVKLLALEQADLLIWLTERPQVAKGLLLQLASRLRHLNEAVADLVFSDVPGRVAKALLDLAKRFGRPTEAGLEVRHELTQEEIAQLVGASRETVNKSLADFASRGWIQLEPKAVTILDTDRLTHRAR